MINKKGDIVYEKIKEDKSRRKAIPKRDLRTNNRKPRPLNYCLDVLYEVYIYLKERTETMAAIVFLVGVWMSGYFAHAGMKFESLLSIVLGAVVLNFLGTWGSK